MRYALDGSGAGNAGKRLAHDFADDELAKVFPLQRESENLIFVNCADGKIFLEDGNLRDVLLLHGFEGVKNGLVRASDDQLANFAGLMLGVNDFGGGDGNGGIHVAALAHPLVIINLAEIAHAGIGEERDDEIVRAEILSETKGGGDAAAAGAAGEKTLELG